MKKILSIVLCAAVISTMCVSLGFTASAATTGTGTETDPYLVSTHDELNSAISSAPEDSMAGEATYIKVTADILREWAITIGGKRNINLNLNGFTLKLYYFGVGTSKSGAAKLKVTNGTIISADSASLFAEAAMRIEFGSVLIADGITFRGGNGVGSSVRAGFGAFIENSTFTITNCNFYSGDSSNNVNYKSALKISGSTGTISNTTLIRGAGNELSGQPTLQILTSTVTDGFGDPLTSSDYKLNTVVIPSAAESTITNVNGMKSKIAKGTYKAGQKSDVIYSVDVAWGSMEFTYTAGAGGTWNPLTHEYVGAGEGTWTNAADANKITVTNHSNAAVDASLSYTAGEGYTAALGTFAETNGTADDGKLALATATGTELAFAPTASANLNLSGTLASGVTNAKIGTVTVTITAQ